MLIKKYTIKLTSINLHGGNSCRFLKQLIWKKQGRDMTFLWMESNGWLVQKQHADLLLWTMRRLTHLWKLPFLEKINPMQFISSENLPFSTLLHFLIVY